MRVEFYYSIGSRYAYLAATQLGRLVEETGCTVEWIPVESPRLIAMRPDNPFAHENPSGLYAPAYRALDLERWARHYGVPYTDPDRRVRFDARELALACTAAKRLGGVEAMSRALYRAMYEGEGPRSIDRRDCIGLASQIGLGEAAFEEAVGSAQTARVLDETVAAAAERGVFGVPTFRVEGEPLFFGNDRPVLLRDHLTSRS